jgi:transcriptional regulator with XRE-family HTH domain
MIIQKLRIEKGWSQSQLADLAGLNVRTIQRIESGSQPSAESLKAIAAVFEIDFNELKEMDKIMETNMTDKEDNLIINKKEFLAYARLNRVKNFYRHLLKYIVIIFVLGAINYWKTPNKLWALWVAVFWGLGLLWHAYRALSDGFSPKWERRFIEKELLKK